MAKKPINYTGRDFQSIRNDLVNYTKRYYPTTFKDFSEASFGALMLDLVAYVGDQLSFYSDFQSNETFIDSAIRYDNVSRLAESMGYKREPAAKSTGIATFFILIPAKANARGPNEAYLPILQRGTVISSDSNAVFTLIEDVDFSDGNNEITVARVDNTTGNPTFFAVRATGQIVSGRRYVDTMTVGDYRRFLRLGLSKTNVTDVMSVRDAQGNEYYQVDYLSQDVVMKEVENVAADRTAVPYIMRLKPVPRRFVTQYSTTGETFLQFGYGSEDNLTGDLIADPADVVLQVTGRDYVSDETFDPTNLIQTDKFGVVPTNTTLTVEYTANTTSTVNVSVGSLTRCPSPRFQFLDEASLDSGLVDTVIGSLEVDNEDPILGDSSIILADEIRERASSAYASQNRAVTRSDYISLVYRMPPKFGRVRKCNVVRDANSLKRNLNLYLLSEDVNGNYVEPNLNLKDNVKTWINRYRMVNDTIDVLNGKIINIGIKFRVIADLEVNKYELLQTCTDKLIRRFLNIKFEIGEAIYISEIYKLLNEVPGVVDTTNVELINRAGGVYSNYVYDVDANLSEDGRYLMIPEDAAAEILLPTTDISGVIT